MLTITARATRSCVRRLVAYRERVAADDSGCSSPNHQRRDTDASSNTGDTAASRFSLAAWIASGSGRGIGTGRGTRGRLYALTFPVSLPIYLFWSFLIVAVEKSGHYVQAAAVTVVAVLVLRIVSLLPGAGGSALRSSGRPATRLIGREHWRPPTPMLGGRLSECCGGTAVWVALLLVIVGAIAGATRVAASPVRDPGRRHRNWPSN